MPSTPDATAGSPSSSPAATAPSQAAPDRISPRRLFRTVATAEAITWALLIAGMLGTYVLGVGDWAVRAGGSVHGFVFLAYCVSTVMVWTDRRWGAGIGIAGLALAIVPFATVPFDRYVERRGLLADRWRIGRGADRRAPRTLPERILALVLRAPALSGLVLLAAIALVYVLLLQAGPPTEWFT